MTKSKFETEGEKWIKRGDMKTYNMTELLTYDEKHSRRPFGRCRSVCICSVHVSPTCDVVYGTDGLEYLTKRGYG